MKRLILAMLFLVGVLSFAAPVRQGVYENSAYAGTYSVFEGNGLLYVLYEAEFVPDEAQDALPGQVKILYMGIKTNSDGSLTSNSYAIIVYNMMDLVDENNTFKATANGGLNVGGKETLSFVKGIDAKEAARIEETMTLFKR